MTHSCYVTADTQAIIPYQIEKFRYPTLIESRLWTMGPSVTAVIATFEASQDPNLCRVGLGLFSMPLDMVFLSASVY